MKLSSGGFFNQFNSGVWSYNLVHYRGLVMALQISGLAAKYPVLILAGGLQQVKPEAGSWAKNR